MAGGVIGMIVWHPSLPGDFPAFTSWNGEISGLAPIGPLWPLMFVTIACGAISGWHSLVSSSGTARQLESEVDALPVGGGSMFLEGFLAIIALLAAAVGVGAVDSFDVINEWLSFDPPIEPDPERVHIYDAFYQQYVDLYETLKESMVKLSELP